MTKPPTRIDTLTIADFIRDAKPVRTFHPKQFEQGG